MATMAPSRALAQPPTRARHLRPLTESVLLCGGVPGAPLDECASVTRVPLVYNGGQDLVHMARTVAEQRIERALENEVHAEYQRRSFGPELSLHYGLELEPRPQYQLRRELIALAAKLIELPPGVRASIMPTPLSSIRSIRQSQELERSAQRATYLDIEEFKGPSQLRATKAEEVGYAGVGVALFTIGGLAARVFRASLSDRFRVQPQPWPPGLQINGHFD